MELEVKTLDGAAAGSITVSDEIFGLDPLDDRGVEGEERGGQR